MPWFTSLDVTLVDDREEFPWEVISPLIWEDPETKEIHEVPIGFRTDGASIPMILSMIPIVGPALALRHFGKGIWFGFKEGVLHDFLRRNDPIPPSEAHLKFKRALIEGGYPEDLIANYYDAVRRFNS